MLTAPYNFVPINEKVVRPDWGGRISHDVPLDEALSGTLELTIEAKSPIYVRQSQARSNTERTTDFSQDAKGRYFIPGSSVKGAIRNVLEILSFGDLAKQTGTERYAMRDLTNPEQYTKHFAGDKVFGGWLQRRDDTIISNGKQIQTTDYVITGACKPGRPHQEAIERIMQRPGAFNVFKQESFRKDNQSARSKYKLFEGCRLKGSYDEQDGTFVFTGQPNIITGRNAKRKEFFFPDIDADSDSSLYVSDDAMKDFRFAYLDHEPDKNQSDDYKWAKAELNKPTELNKPNGRVPVFFLKKNGQVASFGLSYMYKLPYTHSAHTRIREIQNGANPNDADLAECIFGSIDKKTALKGRVIFGHAFADPESAKPADKIESNVLNSPKPTFYPTYLRQETGPNSKVSKFSTLFNSDAIPSGWKRYPVHPGNSTVPNPAPLIRGERNSKVETQYQPLMPGAVFKCTVSYHNLNAIELGALVSAITFHGSNDVFHSLGMAKPLGCGKTVVTIADSAKFETYLDKFERYMEMELKGNWLHSTQVTSLVTMASEMSNQPNSRQELKYMSLEEHRNVKGSQSNEKEGLPLYTELFERSIIRETKSKLQLTASDGNLSPEEEDFKKRFNEQKDRIIKDFKSRYDAAKKEEQASVVLDKGPVVHHLKVKDRAFLDNLKKAIKVFQKSNPLTETHLENIRQKLKEAFAAANDRERARWKAEPQHTWQKLEAHVEAGVLAKWMDDIFTNSPIK